MQFLITIVKCTILFSINPTSEYHFSRALIGQKMVTIRPNSFFSIHKGNRTRGRAKFLVFARKKDGSYNNRNSLITFTVALMYFLGKMYSRKIINS